MADNLDANTGFISLAAKRSHVAVVNKNTDGSYVPLNRTSKKYFRVPYHNGTWKLHGVNGVEEWVKGIPDVQAKASGVTLTDYTSLAWLDDTNDRLYLQCKTSDGSKTQLFYITLSTGVVSLLGPAQSSTSAPITNYVHSCTRLASNGNFLVYVRNKCWEYHKDTGAEVAVRSFSARDTNFCDGYVSKDEQFTVIVEDGREFDSRASDSTWLRVRHKGGQLNTPSRVCANIEGWRPGFAHGCPRHWGSGGVILTHFWSAVNHSLGNCWVDPDEFDQYLMKIMGAA